MNREIETKERVRLMHMMRLLSFAAFLIVGCNSLLDTDPINQNRFAIANNFFNPISVAYTYPYLYETKTDYKRNIPPNDTAVFFSTQMGKDPLAPELTLTRIVLFRENHWGADTLVISEPIRNDEWTKFSYSEEHAFGDLYVFGYP